jgi:hypothetical protein
MRISLLALVATLAACSSGTGGKLSVSTKMASSGGGTTAVAAAGATAALAIDSHVTLDRARILVRKVALEGASSEGTGSGDGAGSSGSVTTTASSGTPSSPETGEGSDSGGGSDGDSGVRFGPFVVDLSGTQLDGGLELLFDQSVPAGTYEELEFQIHKLTPGQTVSDPDFTALGPSVILALTIDGQPVKFTSDLTAAAEIEGPFTVADGGAVNVTVTVDPSGWFKAPDGSFLDPRVDANRAQIEQNVRASIRGFEDDDHDGKPDHGS